MNKVVAWEITDSDAERAVVIFHSHGLAARRLGAERLESDFDDCQCKRAPELDQYVDMPGEPSIETLMTKHGWHWTCHGAKCDNQIEPSYYEDYPDEPRFGFYKGKPYCGECYKDLTNQRGEDDRAEATEK